MKKLLIVLSALVMALTLSACKPDGGDLPDGLESVSLNVVEDKEVWIDSDFNLYDLVTATGSDSVDYSDAIVFNSEACDIDADGNVDTSSARNCVIEYSVIVEGKYASGSFNLEIKLEPQDTSELPTLAEWTFDTAGEVEEWNKYDGDAHEFPFVVSHDEGAMKVELTVIGSSWQPRLEMQDLPYENGELYEWTFRAKSSVDGKIIKLNIGEILTSAPWFTDFNEVDKFFTLTDEWAEYSVQFIMGEDNVNGGLLLEMGGVDGDDTVSTIWFDDIKVVGGSGTDSVGPVVNGADDELVLINGTFDAAEGVTANDFNDGDVTTDMLITGADTVDLTTNGTYTVTYTVSDAAGNETVHERKVVVADFGVDTNNNGPINVMFTTDGELSDGWSKTVGWGSPIFTSVVAGNKLVMDQAKDGEKDYGSNPWDHSTKYTELLLVEGASYRFTFDAVSSEAGVTSDNVIFKVSAGDFVAEDWITITDTESSFELLFTYTGPTTLAGTVEFMTGGREHVITVSNLYVETTPEGLVTDTDPTFVGVKDSKVPTDSAFTVLSGVTATDIEDGEIILTAANVTVSGPNAETTLDLAVAGDWTLTYTVTDADGNVTTEDATLTIDFSSENLMVTWDFENENSLPGWVFENGEVAGVLDNGALKVSYVAGGNPWEPRFTMQNLPLENESTYMVSFRAKSSVTDKIIHLQVGEVLSESPWFVNFKPDDQSEYAALGTDWNTYYYFFDMTIDNVKGGLLFELGNFMSSLDISGDVWIDDVMIYGGSGDSMDPVFAGVTEVTLEQGEAFDDVLGVTAYDLVDGDLTSAIQVAGTVDVNTIGSYTLTYTVDDAAGNTGIATRIVKVVGYVNDVNNDSLTLLVGSDFGYSGVKLINGAQYKIVFDATTDQVANTLENLTLKVVAGDDMVEQNYILTELSDGYELTFKWDGATVIDAEMLFMIVGDTYTLTVENVDVSINSEDAAAVNAPVLSGVMDKMYPSGATVDLLDGVTALDIEDGAYTLVLETNVSVVGPNDETVYDGEDGIWMVTYTVTDADMNETTKEVQIVVGDFNPTTIVPNGTMSAPSWSFWAGYEEWAGFPEATLEFVNGEAVIDVTVAGAHPYSVQFMQDGLDFVGGVEYAVTFTAYADAERAIKVELYGGWNENAVSLEQVLTATETTYTVYITIPSDGTGKVNFHLGNVNGTGAGTINIKDVKVEVRDGEGVVADSDIMLLSEMVEQSKTDPWTPVGTDTELGESYGEANFTYPEVTGGSPWDVKLETNDLEFEEGATYMLTFKARNNEERLFSVNVYDGQNTVFTSGPVMVDNTRGSDWGYVEYTFVFVYNSTDTIANLEFQLGYFGEENSAGTQFDVDNVVISKLGSAPTIMGVQDAVYASGTVVDLMTGVTAVDAMGVDITPVVTISGPNGATEFDGTDGIWMVTYTATDAEMVQTVKTVQIVIGDFEATTIVPNSNMDAPSWGFWAGYEEWAGFPEATLEFVNGEAVIDVTVAGAHPYSVQFMQDGLDFVGGVEYAVTFTAYADAERAIKVELYGGWNENAVSLEQVLTATETTYTVYITIPSDGTGKVNFHLGNVNGTGAGTINIKDVKVEVRDGEGVVADSDIMLLSEMIEVSSTDPWAPVGTDTELGESHGEANFTYPEVTGGNSWETKVELTELVYEQGATYMVTFKARSNEERLVSIDAYDGQNTVFSSGPFTVGQLEQTEANGWGWVDYTFYFVYGSSDTTASLEFQLGNFGEGDSNGTQFDFDEVVISKLVVPAE